MTLTIELSDDMEVALKAHANAQGTTSAGYARQVLADALASIMQQKPKPKKSAYGLLAKYGPGPTAAEIDENRKEMFRSFTENTP